MHIQNAGDLDPKSSGFFNRGAESITIMGNVLSDILNGLGGALSDVTGSNHGSHLNLGRRVSFTEANPDLGNLSGVSAKKLARSRLVDAEVPASGIDGPFRTLKFIGEHEAKI